MFLWAIWPPRLGDELINAIRTNSLEISTILLSINLREVEIFVLNLYEGFVFPEAVFCTLFTIQGFFWKVYVGPIGPLFGGS